MYTVMPVYNREDQDAYLKQMLEWHVRMSQYEDQLKSFHLARASLFRKMVEEKENVMVGNGTV